MKIDFEIGKTIKLCGGKKCCPEITRLNEDDFQITDDYKGKVIVTKNQLKELKFVLKNL